MIELRGGHSDDGTTYQEVFVTDVYRLRDRDLHNSIVLDVGANIGLFSVAAVQAGARFVLAVEPEPENVKQCARNIAGLPVRLMEAAVGPEAGTTLVTGSGTTAHTGNEGRPVPQLSLADLIDRCGGTVDFLKMDCEGAEGPALLATPISVLAAIPYIVVEVHGPPLFPWATGWSRWDLETKLRLTHDVEVLPTLQGLAMLYCTRRTDE